MTYENLDLRALPATRDNLLYLDYLSGAGQARFFFTHAPLDFPAALRSRQGHPYPRSDVAACLRDYNLGLGARPAALQNIQALADPGTYCVIAGQQAGLLGGPAYTAYKIITALRLAGRLQGQLGGRVVPVFWLASEDHDLAEVNHAFFPQRDGEIGQVRFAWADEGRPIADLPVTDEVRRAFDEFFDRLVPGPSLAQARDLFAAQAGESFCAWQARTWSQLFSDRGLVIVEPGILRGAGRDFLLCALENRAEIGRRLGNVAGRLRAAGYAPALDPQQNGALFTFDERGRRVRVEDPQAHLERCAAHPERYSTDAALRPLLADSLLPVLASVLGPGEIAYQAMLKPLYDLFGLPQPLLFPRKSYTLLGRAEADQLARYGTGPAEILSERLDVDASFQILIPAAERAMFAQARQGIAAALAPLQGYLGSIDPNLEKTWAQTVEYAVRNVDKLEEKAVKARLSQLGFSRGQLKSLGNLVYPRGRLQERTFPLPYLISRWGASPLIEQLFAAGELDDFAHHVLTVEEEDE